MDRQPADSKAQRGAAAVEMALVTPLLVLLLFGIIGFGFLLAVDQQIGNGARDGARVAAADPEMMCNQSGAGEDVVSRTQDVAVGILPLTASDVAVEVYLLEAGDDLEDQPPGVLVCTDGPPAPEDVGPVCTDASDGNRVLVTASIRPTAPVALGFLPDEVTGRAVFPCQY